MFRDFYLQAKQKYYAKIDSAYCSSATGLACLPGRSYYFGNAGNPGLGDFDLSIDSAFCTTNPTIVTHATSGNSYGNFTDDCFNVVSIKTLNGPVGDTTIVWFDPVPLAPYKNLRNYVMIYPGQSKAIYYLPEGIPLSVLKVKKIQNPPFKYATMYFNDYFELVASYASYDAYSDSEEGVEHRWNGSYYDFGLKENKFPPNNAFDVYGNLSTYAIGITDPDHNYVFIPDVHFKAYKNFLYTYYYKGKFHSAYVDGDVNYPLYPVNPGCAQEWATKITRFPAIGSPYNSPSPEPVVAQAMEELKSLTKSSCEANADNWMKALELGLNKINATSQQRNELKLRLIEVCKTGGSIDYPTGTSTLPSGQFTVYGDNSFGDAIKAVLNLSSYTSLLNPWVIQSPTPYGVKPQISEKIISNSTAQICAKLEAYRPAGYNNAQFYNHLVDMYGSVMSLSQSDFEALLKSCGDCKYLIAHNIKLPFLFEADSKGCITRAQFNTAMANLSAEITGGLSLVDGDSLTYTNIVANYMNQTFGYGLSFEQYNQFNTSSNFSLLCNEPPYTSTEGDSYAEVKILLGIAVTNGKSDYQYYITEEKNRFRISYISTCTSARPNVQLSASTQLYHYTLYYYDQADNLVRTVPPEGVTFLTAKEVQQVARYRDGTLANCQSGPQENADKQVAFQKLANVLSNNGNAAVEQWLYKADGGGHFMATTPNRDFIFNTCISGNYVNVDIYSAQGDEGSVTLTHSNHIAANISGIMPLQPWTHLVVQGNYLAQGTLDIYVNGSKFTAVSKPLNVGCDWLLGGDPFVLPENMQHIKHLRLYTRLMQPLEILENANSGCYNVADNTAMEWFRFNFDAQDNLPSPIFPNHLLKTSYAYNSLNQVVEQQTPDAGKSRFAYDDLGRLVFSQNARQAQNQQVSYTLYDGLSRVVEVAQMNSVSNAEDLFGVGYWNNYAANWYINQNNNREQLTRTYYDAPIDGFGLFTPFTQENLRKRVAASAYQDTYTGAPQQITYYTYDIAGNVKTLGNYISGLGQKRLDYEYDLISGKVNFLAYQHSQPDAFYYKYDYDAENRLIKAWSATQAEYKPYGGSYMLNARLDAEYEYYLHGPLRRVELGDEENKVQGLDYAYTLQGWLKGLNGTALTQNDMGSDGNTIAQDALAFSLGYYQHDYAPIGGTNANALAHAYQPNMADAAGRNLYNGNISHSTYAIMGINSGATAGYTYGYDQLNRIKMLRQHSLGSNGDWNFSSATDNFKEQFSYDGNGNILTLNRYNQSGSLMDNLSYTYNRDINNRLLNNRLNQVANPVAVSGSVAGTSYGYDAIGNLIKDTQEGISNINWNVYGKIKSITKNSGNISYTYDAAGNRVSKTHNGKSTYYLRDAQGNTLAVYDKKGTSPSCSLGYGYIRVKGH
jgi:YD repeat-containing protein